MMMVKSSDDGRSCELRCPSCLETKPIGAGAVLRERKPADDYPEYARYLTPQLSNDPALPRDPRIVCPFCDKAGDVLYVKYNAKNMKFVYHCGACKEFWKRGGEAVRVRDHAS